MLYINFILDKSGSMASIEKSVVDGFNDFLRTQRTIKGETPRMTLTLFDTEVRMVYTGLPLDQISAMDSQSYRPGGNTALLDAVGATIRRVEGMIGPDDAVLTVIFTDGEENSSTEWTKDALRAAIEGKTAEGWEFLFLGANIDSFAEAGSIGIAAGSTQNYVASASGTQSAYLNVNSTTSAWRTKNTK